MASMALPGGMFAMADGLTVTRMGYGAMQLAGPHVFGPPRTAPVPSQCCAKRSNWESRTSTPVTTTARTSRMRSSRRPCIRTRNPCTLSPRSARCETRRVGGPSTSTRAVASGGPRQLGSPRPRRTRRGQPSRWRIQRRYCGLDRRTLRRARAAAAGGSDQAPRHQHSLRRADRRGPDHRADRGCAEFL